MPFPGRLKLAVLWVPGVDGLRYFPFGFTCAVCACSQSAPALDYISQEASRARGVTWSPVGVALRGARSGRGICDFLLFNAQAARLRLGLVQTRERVPGSRPGRMRESLCPPAWP